MLRMGVIASRESKWKAKRFTDTSDTSGGTSDSSAETKQQNNIYNKKFETEIQMTFRTAIADERNAEKEFRALIWIFL